MGIIKTVYQLACSEIVMSPRALAFILPARKRKPNGSANNLASNSLTIIASATKLVGSQKEGIERWNR
jgi:hypothetical protein